MRTSDILNELLKESLPEIRDAARAEKEGQRYDDASDLIAKVKTVFSKMTVELERRSLYVWPAQQDRVYGKAHAEVEHP